MIYGLHLIYVNMFHALGCFTIKVDSFEEMPKYIVHPLFRFLFIYFVYAHICLRRRMSSNGLI